MQPEDNISKLPPPGSGAPDGQIELFYVREDRHITGGRCFIHRGRCRWCKDGTGVRGRGGRTPKEIWHPGVPTLAEATELAQATGAVSIQLCQHCLANGEALQESVPDEGGRYYPRCFWLHRVQRADQLVERFWSRVSMGEGCWPWTGHRMPNGYGRISLTVDDKRVELTAHRVAYLLTYGYVPEGLDICHSCDNPGCCRPTHLFAGTRKENWDDMFNKGRYRFRTHCGTRSGSAKLTDEQVAEIHVRAKAGEGPSALARAFGVTPASIRAILTGRAWRSGSASVLYHQLPGDTARPMVTTGEDGAQ